MHGNIFKLKKDKVQVWREWATYLLSREEEVRGTLTEEGLAFEGSFIFRYKEDDFVCVYAKANATVADANLEKEINVQHRNKMKECFEEKISSLDSLYFFESN